MGERWEIGGYKLKRCPIKSITHEGLQYIEAYKFYKNGILPMPGGWLNQSRVFVEAVDLIEKEINAIEKKNRKANQG